MAEKSCSSVLSANLDATFFMAVPRSLAGNSRALVLRRFRAIHPSSRPAIHPAKRLAIQQAIQRAIQRAIQQASRPASLLTGLMAPWSSAGAVRCIVTPGPFDQPRATSCDRRHCRSGHTGKGGCRLCGLRPGARVRETAVPGRCQTGTVAPAARLSNLRLAHLRT